MTTNSSSSSPKPDNSRQRLIAIAAVIIVALLGINAFLLVSYNSRGKVAKELTSKLDESEQLKAELEKQYYEALSELEGMRGSNEELNALIEKQKGELKESKERIDGLLATRGNLDKARKEIKNLTAQVEQYLAELNQLRQENEELMAQNTVLNEEKETLTTELTTERTAREELSSEKAMLVSEKQMLEADKAFLAKKVNIASVIKVENIEVSGLKTKSSGKAVKKRYAKNVDQIQVCFNTTVNNVAEEGAERFHIRIINPIGETIAIEEMGSGVFINNATGEEIRYTQIKEYDYKNDANTLCSTWSSSQSFPEGNYEIQVYNKGHLAGSTSFQLK
jgi:regulator of replication initiation timing